LNFTMNWSVVTGAVDEARRGTAGGTAGSSAAEAGGAISAPATRAATPAEVRNEDKYVRRV
jgi:hypothetical protein